MAAAAARLIQNLGSSGFLLTSGAGRSSAEYRRRSVIYSQGETAGGVLFVQQGRVLLSVVSDCGKEAILGIVGPGGILGAGCIFDEPYRSSTAIALERVSLVRIEKQDLKYVLAHSVEFNQEFLRCLLRQKRETEEALADQLFSSSERRLARILMMLSHNPQGIPGGPIPRLSQTTLAAMVGTTRSRISYFLGKFRQMGLIEGGTKIRVNAARMSAMLKQCIPSRAIEAAQ